LIRAEEHHLTAAELLALLAVVTMTVAPHFAHSNAWVSLFFATTGGYRLAAIRYPRLLPGRLLLFLATLAALAVVLLTHVQLFDWRVAVDLLIVLVGLKLLELRRRRDIYVTLFLGYFVIATNFLFEQGLLLTAWLLLAFTGLTALLLETSRSRSLRRPLKTLALTLSLLAQAVPLMVALFLFFPRLSAPLWSFGIDQQRGVTGLGDTVSPGSISELMRSHAVAFRVDFEAPPPAPPLRYWRGPVLWETDGVTWRRGEAAEPGAADYAPLGEALDYSVTLEPGGGRWLLALDLPAAPPPQASMQSDYMLLADKPVTQRLRYRMRSHLRYNTGALDARARDFALQLPANVTPRMTRLVSAWQAAAAEQQDAAAAVVAQALQYFREQPFYYTLYPPLLGSNPVDEFLFESRRGFCEHYASSFVTLMRIAAVPARLVTGYQGGEINPLGGHLVVRQSDAHAWAEVWLEGAGWVRVDPTAAVAPQRVERPFDVAYDEQAVSGAPLQFNLRHSGLLQRLARQLRLGADAVNASWHRWVLGYSQRQQGRLLQRLGLDFDKGAAVAIAVSLLLLAALTAALLWYRGREPRDPVQLAYQRFCARIAREGIVRRPHEGAQSYARRIVARRPELRTAVEEITELYNSLRYAETDTAGKRGELRRLVRSLRV
jgi:protein-glutamine gamma-glutamyltransferase